MKIPDSEATKLQREIAAREFSRRRLPLDLRKRCERYAADRTAAGASKNAIARELGVSATSVHRWLSGLPTGTLVPVRIVERAAPVAIATPEAIVIVTASGLRIEGLDLHSVCTLIARVG